MKKLFLIENGNHVDYDMYSSAVVVARNEDAARLMHPNGKTDGSWDTSTWCPVKRVQVTYIGTAARHLKIGEILITDFLAG